MSDSSAHAHFETSVVALGRPPRTRGEALNAPITLTSTFVGSRSPETDDRVYARFSNPSWEPLEDAIAALEGSAHAGISYASGMATVAAAFSLVPVGGVAVVPGASYNGTIGLARELQADGLFSLREVDPTNIDDTIAAFSGADLVWLESPTNPMLDVLDLPVLIAAAKKAGAFVVIDNTFSTPLRQRPLALGADLVVHSATKFIAGHSDVLLGLAVAADGAVRDRLLAKRALQGSIAGPFEAWLTLRGLRTLAVRLDRAEASAAELAVRLQQRSEISRVRYPGLVDDPGHQLAVAGLDGFGAMISIELTGGASAAEHFVEALRVFTPATSLGGVESLAERRRRLPSEPSAVPDSLVRLSIGIEHIEDLWADLAAALDSIPAAS